MPLSFRPLDIPGLILITPSNSEDERGSFAETFKKSVFAENAIATDFVQENCSRSRKDVVRGLHYQLHPAAQGKLVRIARGAVFDVTVDLRHGSPGFGRWFGIHLSSEAHDMLWVPPGFAHGFCALTDEVEVIYKVTAEYSPHHERGIAWDDPSIGIEWPVAHPVLSAKDASLPRLDSAEMNFVYHQT